MNAFYAQGYRCGHLEGRDRVGIYVIGEESALSYEAAETHPALMRDERAQWASGYRNGYRAGASGDVVPRHLATWPLPGEDR